MTNTSMTSTESSAKFRLARRLVLGAAVGGAVLLASGSPASAQECSYPEVCVKPATLDPEPAQPQAPAPQPDVQGAVQTPATQQLPVTGSDAGTIAAAGLAMVGAGVFLSRRSSANAATTD